MKSILAGVVAALPVSTFVNLACAAGPRAVDKPGGRVFVSDSGNNLIQVLQGYGRQQHHQHIQLHLRRLGRHSHSNSVLCTATAERRAVTRGDQPAQARRIISEGLSRR